MPVRVNLRHLEDANVHLEGEIEPAELDCDNVDEVIHVRKPLSYVLDVERANQTLLVTGRVTQPLLCECVRCLQPFEKVIELTPWECVVPLEGEDRAPVDNDCVDLTPFLREDILLAFPQHPLCKPQCNGLPPDKKIFGGGDAALTTENASAWAELNKLKF